MKKVFVSSVVQGFEDHRRACRGAIDLMGHRPRMCEDFAARPHSSQQACVTEVEDSDVYVLVLGERFGFEAEPGVSITQQEFRAARDIGKPVLAFVQEGVEMEPAQRAFREEVEDFHQGFFRAPFQTPEQLKDQLIKALRQLEAVDQAAPKGQFEERADDALRRFITEDGHPVLAVVFWPQPVRDVDIIREESRLDRVFSQLCEASLAQMREGYAPLTDRDYTGLVSRKSYYYRFEDGLIILLFSPTIEREGWLFSSYFAAPSRIRQLCSGADRFAEANSVWSGIGLYNVANVRIEEPPVENTSSMSMKMFGKEEAFVSRRLMPLTEAGYREWVEHAVGRLQRYLS